MAMDSGWNFTLVVFLSGIGFAAFTEWIYFKTGYAAYLMVLMALQICLRLGSKKRRENIELMFGPDQAKSIRLFENLVVCVPWSVSLLIHGLWLAALCLWVTAALIAFWVRKAELSLAIPTPFGKRPWEFASGFRKNILLLTLFHVLAVLAAGIGNANLGHGSLVFIILLSCTFCLRIESPTYVWMYHLTPLAFLKKKIGTAALQLVSLCLPVCLLLLWFFPAEWKIEMILISIGVLAVAVVMLAKYANYPHELSVPDAMMLTLAIYFPPILIAFLPFFYHRAIRKLSPILL